MLRLVFIVGCEFSIQTMIQAMTATDGKKAGKDGFLKTNKQGKDERP